MTETAAATAAPATSTSTFSDAELLQLITFQLDAARREQAAALARVRESDSVTYAAQWSVEGAVEAETRITILTTAVTAAARGQLRQALAYQIAAHLGVSSRGSSPFDRAVAEIQREVAVKMLSNYGAEIDPATLFNRV